MSNRVEAIRNEKKIKSIKNNLKNANKTRDYVLFVLGINFGLRIGDLLNLQVEDVFDYSGKIKERIEIIEEKTGKNNFIKINTQARKALNILLEKEKNILTNKNNYIIYNTRNKYNNISRVQAYKLIKKWCRKVGLTENKIGTQTLRKSWGYHAYKQGISIEVIQKKYKHSSPVTTRKYLGIERKNVNKAYDEVDL